MTEPRKGPRQRGNESPLTQARMAAGMTQGQLAEAVGCTQKDISRWERGHNAPNAANLARIAQALGCSMEQLL